MKILYTSTNIPLLEMDSGEVYPFTPQNAEVIIGELSVNIDECYAIKNKIIDVVKKTVDKKQLTDSSTPEQISIFINGLNQLNEYHIINEIVDRSIKMYKMITTPKPYETWVWDSLKEEWVSPIERPKKLVESEPDKYIWSDEHVNWIPAEPAPHRSWTWNSDLEKYVPPVPYPVDANPEEFKWDEEKLLWVIND